MSFKRIISALIVTSFFLVNQVTAAEKFEIDPSHSEVQFSVSHMVISTVKGNFNEFSGTIHYDEDNIGNSSVEVTIQTASVDTDNQKRDDHLRSEDFFAAEEYPTITFKSTNIEDKGGDKFAMTGDLTIREVTKSVTLNCEIKGKIQDPYGNTRLGAEGSVTIDRTDYNVNWSKTMEAGGLVVGKEVTIDLNIEAIKPGDKE